MKTKPPTDRRKFAGEWDEIDYLYDKLLYWLYQREDTNKARPFAERLEQLLPKASPDHQAIFGEECWSLAYEARQDLKKAIEHRENEIRLIRRLHAVSRNSVNKELLLTNYAYGDLSDCLDLLATLYRDDGNLDKAITTLLESKKLCETHRIKFDGADILRECVREKRASSKSRSEGKKLNVAAPRPRKTG
jgi:tetratricopeptide (TPR) repeat protein